MHNCNLEPERARGISGSLWLSEFAYKTVAWLTTQAYLGSDLWVPVSLSNSKTSFADLTTRQKLQGVTICARPRGVMVSPILSKSESPGSPDSADNFEFSAERLSENAKSIKITLFAELLTAISPIYVQSLLNLSTKTLKHTICSTKMPH